MKSQGRASGAIGALWRERRALAALALLLALLPGLAAPAIAFAGAPGGGLLCGPGASGGPPGGASPTSGATPACCATACCHVPAVSAGAPAPSAILVWLRLEQRPPRAANAIETAASAVPRIRAPPAIV